MNKAQCHKLSHLFYVIGLVLLIATEGMGQEITVNGGNITSTITTGIAGGQLVNVVNTITSLTYNKQKVIAKVTVMTSCPGQRFNLSVVAISATIGVAGPEVILINGNPAVDFITGIPKTGAKAGTCTLQYTAYATFDQGNSTELGNDVHTITYTIQLQ